MKKVDSELKRMHLLMPVPLLKKIEDWRRRESELPNLSEAIRRLIEAGLDARKPRPSR